MNTQNMTTLRKRDRIKFNAFWLLDHCLGEANVDGLLSKAREKQRNVMHEHLESLPDQKLKPVERRRDLSHREFRDHYVKNSIPVVFEGGAENWPCVQKWSPEFFNEHYSDERILLINASTQDIKDNIKDPGSHARFGDVIDAIRQGSKTYPRFLSLLHDHPELLRDYDHKWLKSLTHRISIDNLIQFFMGGEGTNTALHNAIPANLFVQIYGEKYWRIYPSDCAPMFKPNVNRSTYFFSETDVLHHPEPIISKLKGWDVTLKPGDILYNPPFYWHQVKNLSTTIGVGFRWFPVRSILRSSLTQAALTLMATNPSVRVARRNRKNFPKNFHLSYKDKSVESVEAGE